MEADQFQRAPLPQLFRPGSMHPPDKPRYFNSPSPVPARRMSMTDAGRKPMMPTPPAPAAALDLASAFQHLPFQRLKFVSNDGQPHAKRRRIAAACRTCRKRKTRCSGEKPACETCKQNRQECLGYTESTPKGKSPPRHHHQGQIRDVEIRGGGGGDMENISSIHIKHAQEDIPSRSPTPRSHQRHASQPTFLPSHVSIKPEESPASSPRLHSPEYIIKESNAEDSERSEHRSDTIRDFGLPDDDDDGVRQEVTTPFLETTSQQRGNRIPYFRYFGPTAIVPGFKQMVVEVRQPKPVYSQSVSSASTVGSPPSSYDCATPIMLSPSNRDSEDGVPFYEPSEAGPVDPLIFILVDEFFIHVGANFPFLRRDVFTRDVEDKKVDALLVDAVCAVSARFSSHPLFRRHPPSAAGKHFSNRAKSSVVETFSCPSLQAVQACLLLAYAEFGSNRDSGLWMFLGCAIRMAQDLGLHKLDGIHDDGTRIIAESNAGWSRSLSPTNRAKTRIDGSEAGTFQEFEGADDKERTDTFWAVYFLDRVASSGTGRPVTLKDAEIEIHMPPVNEPQSDDEYPHPFRGLIHIIYLYGIATDKLNNINTSGDPNQTIEGLKGLSEMAEVLYRQLPGELQFSVANFQHYVKINQSAVFLLLHFWFHALIVLLHRPNVLQGVDGEPQQLFPESNELSTSSAKTIVDIYAFAEAVDADMRSVTGNPFNSQPIYIAACAFLQESATHGLISRTLSTPMDQDLGQSLVSAGSAVTNAANLASSKPRRNSSSHSLLAIASHEHYQRCYKALKDIEPYWQGVKYILAVMDQKAKGVVDPLLYIPDEEIESVEVHQWGRKVWSLLKRREKVVEPIGEGIGVPEMLARGNSEFPDEAIGLSMTGFTDSVNSTYNVHYQQHPERPQAAFPSSPAPTNAGHHQQQQQQQMGHSPHSTPCSYANTHTPLTTAAAVNPGVPMSTGGGGAYLQSGGGGGGFDQRALAVIFDAGGSSLETGVVDLGILSAEMGIPDWYTLEYMPHPVEGGGGGGGGGMGFEQRKSDGRVCQW